MPHVPRAEHACGRVDGCVRVDPCCIRNRQSVSLFHWLKQTFAYYRRFQFLVQEQTEKSSQMIVALVHLNHRMNAWNVLLEDGERYACGSQYVLHDRR